MPINLKIFFTFKCTGKWISPKFNRPTFFAIKVSQIKIQIDSMCSDMRDELTSTVVPVYYGHLGTSKKFPDYQGVLIFQVILYDQVPFGTSTKCLDYAGVLIFKCPRQQVITVILSRLFPNIILCRCLYYLSFNASRGH